MNLKDKPELYPDTMEKLNELEELGVDASVYTMRDAKYHIGIDGELIAWSSFFKIEDVEKCLDCMIAAVNYLKEKIGGDTWQRLV